MLRAFIRIWLLTLLSQAETCYANLINPPGTLLSDDLFSRNLDIKPAIAVDSLVVISESKVLNRMQHQFSESIPAPKNMVINAPPLHGKSSLNSLLYLGVIVFLTLLLTGQWLRIRYWRSRTQKQQQQLNTLTTQLKQAQFQLESNMTLSKGLLQQVNQQRHSRESLLLSLNEDIADPISVIQTSFIGWIKMSRLNDVMLEKARLIEKSVERVERFLKHTRFALASANQTQQETRCDLLPVLKNIQQTWSSSVELHCPSTPSNCWVQGDKTVIRFILNNFVAEISNSGGDTSKLLIQIKENNKHVILILKSHSDVNNKIQPGVDIDRCNDVLSFVKDVAVQSDIQIIQTEDDGLSSIHLQFQRYQRLQTEGSTVPTKPVPPVVFEDAQQPVLHHPGPKPDSPKCLVIESSPEMQICIVQAMQEHFCCKGIFNNETALQQVREWQPDIIISELQTENSDGFNLIKELRNNALETAPAILIVTNKVTTENKLKALELDVDSFLEKPFSEELLLKTAIKITHRQQRIRQEDEVRENVHFQQSKDAIFLAQLNALIEKHIANSEFTFEDYFGQFALSKRQFFRRVNTLTRCTPKQYLIQKRLELARHLLGKGVLLEDVTQRCGFKDEQSLMKVYEAHFGEEMV